LSNMSRAGKLILLCAISANGSTPLSTGIHANLFGNTGHSPKREHFQSDGPNIKAIGRLYTQGITNCSATLLPPGDIVVTAAHCFFGKSENRIPLEFEYRFITGGDTPAEGESVSLIPESLFLLTDTPIQIPELDLAFVKLSRHLDQKKYPPAQFASILSTEALKKNIEVRLTGYMESKKPGEDGLATTEICLSKGYFPESKELLHDCSTTEGMSGSPVYIIRDGKVAILGIHNGANRSNGGKITDFDIAIANRAAGSDLAEPAYQKYLVSAGEPSIK
jgi:hypothetical protein